MVDRINRTWNVGPYWVSEIESHSFPEYENMSLYRVVVEGEERPDSELYLSLDHALAAGIARRWTGPRGAGGTGVGTAADWFMTMIGAGDPQTLPERADEINERRHVETRARIAQRERQNRLRQAAANSIKAVRRTDDLLG